jgi:hypothetical protein
VSRRYGGIDPPDAEYIDRERQVQADVIDDSGRASQRSSKELTRTPIADPPGLYDVRCIYDSRPPNAYDFNLTQTINSGDVTPNSVFTFQVPAGYRAVPREWRIVVNPMPFLSSTAAEDAIQLVLQTNGADMLFNTQSIGSGMTGPMRSFFIVEEIAPFGCRIVDPGGLLIAAGSSITVNVYGNLLPVTNVALPFEVTNRKL